MNFCLFLAVIKGLRGFKVKFYFGQKRYKQVIIQARVPGCDDCNGTLDEKCKTRIYEGHREEGAKQTK